MTVPAVAKGEVYFGARDDGVYALSASNGALKWHYQTGDIVRASHMVVGGAFYIGSNDSIDADVQLAHAHFR